MTSKQETKTNGILKTVHLFATVENTEIDLIAYLFFLWYFYVVYNSFFTKIIFFNTFYL